MSLLRVHCPSCRAPTGITCHPGCNGASRVIAALESENAALKAKNDSQAGAILSFHLVVAERDSLLIRQRLLEACVEAAREREAHSPTLARYVGGQSHHQMVAHQLNLKIKKALSALDSADEGKRG